MSCRRGKKSRCHVSRKALLCYEHVTTTPANARKQAHDIVSNALHASSALRGPARGDARFGYTRGRIRNENVGRAACVTWLLPLPCLAVTKSPNVSRREQTNSSLGAEIAWPTAIAAR